MSHTIHTTARELADLCAAKNAAYGDSVAKAAAMLAVQHPNGLRPDQYHDALIDARIFEKQLRRAQQSDANSADPHAEDPREDRAGYALLSLHHARTSSLKEQAPQCPGSASDPSAAETSKAQPGSAASSTSAPTTPNAAASSAPKSSPSPAASSANTSAPASIPTATAAVPTVLSPEAASAREGDLARARDRNDGIMCGTCQRHLLHLPIIHTVEIDGAGYLFCSDDCAAVFNAETTS